jgi:flagellar hook-associated protein 3 FlgL
MRITFNGQFRDSAEAIHTSSAQLVDMQRQVATGKRLHKVSDDPGAATTSVAERNALGAVEQYERTSDSVGSRLAVIDTTLSAIVEKLSQVQQAAFAGRGSTKTQQQRDGAAQAITGLKAALLEDLNMSFHGTYVFAGASATTSPFTTGGGGVVNPYAGSTTDMEVDVGENRSVKVAFDGNTIAQGSAAQHVFDDIDDLITALSTGDEPGTTVALTAIKAAFTRATSAQSRLGNDLRELDSHKLRLQQMKLSGMERLSKLEDANMAEAIVGMSNAEAAYNAALGAVSSATRLSLMDYMK